MVEDTQEASDVSAQAAHERKISPRGDLIQSLVWIAVGLATLIESLRMDRLENQDINPYTVPGLLPGCLGIAIVFFGLLMVYRSISRHALAPQIEKPITPAMRHELNRMWTILFLCIGFSCGLVGHGLPFWAAAAMFITITISVLQFDQLKKNNTVKRGLFMAAVIGLCAGVTIMLVFQEFFLVRLP